jgi:hypothetical protein
MLDAVFKKKERYMWLKNSFFLFVMGSLLCMFSSCIKYQDLIKSEFPQGNDVSDKRDVAAKYVRNGTVYDEFQTKGVFSALLLSDEVRTAYVDIFAHKRGLSALAQEEMLKRQLEENRHWISVYVIADIRDKTYTSLSEKNAFWTLFITCDEKKIIPESIKEVDLEPEFQLFFGPSFTLFKTAYLIKFPLAHKEHELSTAPINYKKISLTIESTYKACELLWFTSQLKTKKKVMRNEDFYWG